jgi:hypothetical protein
MVSYRTKLSTYVSRKIKSELPELVFQPTLGDTMELVQGELRALAAQGQTSPVHVEDGVVQIPLGIRKFAIYRPGASNIRNVASVFTTAVYQNQIAVTSPYC